MSVKAFDIVTCIDNVQPSIHCLECCGKNLYVGTSDSFLLQYLVEEHHQPQLQFHCAKQKQKFIGSKKPVLIIKAASALNRLLVLCDNTLFLLNIFDLEFIRGGEKVKGVTSFCINQDPNSNNPFSLEICVARKRSLQINNVTEDKIIPVKEMPLPETPNAMAMDGKYICVALTSKYALLDCESGALQDILPYGIIVTNPLIARISKGEFLLNGPNSLGVFVTTARISERPPLQWSASLTCVAFAHPYILVLDVESLAVYSILDHKQKQRIQFHSGCCLDNYDGKIFAASSTCIYALVSIPWDKQVRTLLSDGRVEEALELANSCHWSGLTKDQFRKIYRRFQQEAGFIEFSRFNFNRAQDLFLSGQLDPRELISLYPELLPASSDFVRNAASLHSIANVSQMCKEDQDKIVKCRDFLVRYLAEARETKNNFKCQKDVDAVLLKLYAEINSPDLTALIVAADCKDRIPECAECLERNGRHHALALLYSHHGHNEKALGIWIDLLEGRSQDESFPGLAFVVEVLANVDDYSLLWKYAGNVLSRDPELGAKIFTDRVQTRNGESCSIKPEAVSRFLQQYPEALVKYLEYLVFVLNDKKEQFHTHLAALYLNNAIELFNDENVNNSQLAKAREKLQHMLSYSSEYRFQFLLAKLQNTNFHLETALLYGKLEEHEKALKLLVHTLNDPQAARDYCVHYAKNRDVPYKRKLFHTLLSVYLDPQLTTEQQENFFQPTISLLNSDDAEFDASEVLKLLPDHWSVSIVDHFLSRVLRKTMHQQRMKQMEKSLTKWENIQTRFAQYWHQRTPFVLTEETTCVICGGVFTSCEFVRYPSGEIVHLHCSKRVESNTKQGSTGEHSKASIAQTKR